MELNKPDAGDGRKPRLIRSVGRKVERHDESTSDAPIQPYHHS